jgi:hypothetical protein
MMKFPIYGKLTYSSNQQPESVFLAMAKQQTWGLNQDFVGCVVDLG